MDRIVGPAPPTGAPPLESLRWVRRFYTRVSLPILVVLAIAVGVAGGSGWIWLVIGGCAFVSLCGLALLTYQINRAVNARGDQ
jgi:hypothetical protein